MTTLKITRGNQKPEMTKNRKCNGKTKKDKMTNNVLQNTTYTIHNSENRNPSKTELRWHGWICSSWSTSNIRRATFKPHVHHIKISLQRPIISIQLRWDCAIVFKLGLLMNKTDILLMWRSITFNQSKTSIWFFLQICFYM